MLQRLNLGVVVAVITGSVFGVVTAIEGNIARTVGAINASLLEHSIAGLIAIPAILFIIFSGRLEWGTAKSVLPMSAVVGVLVLIAVAGVAFAMPRIGVTTGNMLIVLGQMVIVVLIDTYGIAGYSKVPLSLPRIAGLLLMVGGIFLVLPRNT
jgi:transporter family-2 protein